MTQSNKRPNNPPRQPVRRALAGAQPQRPAPQRSAAAPRPQNTAAGQPRRAPAQPVRRSAPAPAARSGGVFTGDILKIFIGGALVVVLAFLLQRAWPNGFPLVKATDNGAAVEKVSEIFSEGPVRINEIMTSNRNTLSLDDGSSPDWIEVANIGASAVSLEGYSLSKSANSTTVFTFPAITLAPNESVLVYADSRLREDAAELLHAPFRISSAGDTLMLFNAGGSAIDTVNIPALAADQSYARMGDFEWQNSAMPTPGFANTEEAYRLMYEPVTDSPVIITELMASNVSTLADENGLYNDYIEICNRGSDPVSLNGWYLTDDAQSLRKWRIPDVLLNPGECLVVFASGLDRSEDTAHLHTNFGLNPEGETVLLVNNEGRIMFEVRYDLLKADKAWSLGADGSWGSSAQPSPGRAN